jgi:hypothetical protein
MFLYCLGKGLVRATEKGFEEQDIHEVSIERLGERGKENENYVNKLKIL